MAFWISHVDRNALLVSCNAAEPRAGAIHVKLAPDAQWVANARWFHFYYLGAKVSTRQFHQLKSLWLPVDGHTQEVVQQTVLQSAVQVPVL